MKEVYNLRKKPWKWLVFLEYIALYECQLCIVIWKEKVTKL